MNDPGKSGGNVVTNDVDLAFPALIPVPVHLALIAMARALTKWGGVICTRFVQMGKR